MAYTVQWGSKIIEIPKADLQLVQSDPTEIRQLDLMEFRSQARQLSASLDGMPFDEVVNHIAPISVGSVTLARVVEVVNDWTITFEDGTYSVNLVGANTNLHERTNRNQVSVWPNNSAGLTYSRQIEDQSYEGGKVFIDPDRGLSGTGYPRGTPSDPVGNWEDAKVIAGLRKFYKFALEGELVFDGTEDIVDTDWFGNTKIQSRIVLSGNDVSNNVFQLMDISGTMAGYCTIKESKIENLSGFRGTAILSHLAGTIEIAEAEAGETIIFERCIDASASGEVPVLDCAGSLADIVLQGYHGGLIVRNHTGGGKIEINADAAEVTIESSCDSGTITIRGRCKVVDNSSPGCTVVDQATTTGALSTDEHEKLMGLPDATLETDERSALLTTLSEQRATELLFERSNVVDGGMITEYTAGGDVVVVVQRDADDIPIAETIQ